MPDYPRFRVPGSTYFFTVNLLERRQDWFGMSMRCAMRCERGTVRTEYFHFLR